MRSLLDLSSAIRVLRHSYAPCRCIIRRISSQYLLAIPRHCYQCRTALLWFVLMGVQHMAAELGAGESGGAGLSAQGNRHCHTPPVSAAVGASDTKTRYEIACIHVYRAYHFTALCMIQLCTLMPDAYCEIYWSNVYEHYDDMPRDIRPDRGIRRVFAPARQDLHGLHRYKKRDREGNRYPILLYGPSGTG